MSKLKLFDAEQVAMKMKQFKNIHRTHMDVIYEIHITINVGNMLTSIMDDFEFDITITKLNEKILLFSRKSF